MIQSIIRKTLAQGPPVRTFLDGSQYWVVDLASVRVGLGHFQPGWIWSEHAGAQTGMESEAHIGYIQSGSMIVASAEGAQVELGPGDAFELAAGSNAWVVGNEVCVALDVAVKPKGGESS